MPDEALFRLAEQGQLRRPAVFEAQVKRMIADPRADALMQNFAGQWLHVRNLQNAAPNTDEFPDFDNDLRESLRREIEMFFGAVLREDRPVLDLLTANDTFVNERLAKHYDIPYVYGSQFRRVTLTERSRRGAGQGQHPAGHVARRSPGAGAAWQMEPQRTARHAAATSTPGRSATRADRRHSAKDDEGADGGATHRTRRAPDAHRLTDPLGRPEHFDGVGAYRVARGRAPGGCHRTAPDGTPANGVTSLRQASPEAPGCLCFHTHREADDLRDRPGLEAYDMPGVREMFVMPAAGLPFLVAADGHRAEVPFQMRRSGKA